MIVTCFPPPQIPLRNRAWYLILRFDWIDNKIVGLFGTADLTGVTRLNKRKGENATLAGWNILTFRGCAIAYDPSTKNIATIRIKNHGREFVAARID